MAGIFSNQLGLQIVNHHVVVKGRLDYINQFLSVKVGPHGFPFSSHLDFLLKFAIAISADYMNFFGGPDNGPTTGTNILPGTVLLAGTLQAGDPWPYKGKTRFPKALNKFKGFRVQGCFVPAVLIAFLHCQAVGFSGFLKLLVVV
ncbi:MAG: hypothetical protein ACLUDS_05115 [Acutalibacteraceae bacterium]